VLCETELRKEIEAYKVKLNQNKKKLKKSIENVSLCERKIRPRHLGELQKLRECVIFLQRKEDEMQHIVQDTLNQEIEMLLKDVKDLKTGISEAIALIVCNQEKIDMLYYRISTGEEEFVDLTRYKKEKKIKEVRKKLKKLSRFRFKVNHLEEERKTLMSLNTGLREDFKILYKKILCSTAVTESFSAELCRSISAPTESKLKRVLQESLLKRKSVSQLEVKRYSLLRDRLCMVQRWKILVGKLTENERELRACYVETRPKMEEWFRNYFEEPASNQTRRGEDELKWTLENNKLRSALHINYDRTELKLVNLKADLKESQREEKSRTQSSIEDALSQSKIEKLEEQVKNSCVQRSKI